MRRRANCFARDTRGARLAVAMKCALRKLAAMLKESGSEVRPPLSGEFGWQGGMVTKGRAGNLVAAFSGGHSKDDLPYWRRGLRFWRFYFDRARCDTGLGLIEIYDVQ